MDVAVSERVKVHLALVCMQIFYAAGSVLNKAALNNGLNPIVFVVYRDAVAALFLLLIAPVMERGRRPRAYPVVIGLCVALAFTWVFGFELLYMIGLSLTSVQLQGGLVITIPVFAGVIAAIFRTEKVGLLKVAGIAFCVGGAAVMTLFKGPAQFSRVNENGDFHFSSVAEWINGGNFHMQLAKWQLGALLLLASCICAAASVNIQVPLLARYPAPISITGLSYLVGTIIVLLFSWLNVKDSSDWKVKHVIEIIAIIYAGVISSAINLVLQAWCVHKAGPILVISYAPVLTIFTIILGIVVLKESLHLGSILGAISIAIGLYLVIWGQKKQAHDKRSLDQENISSSVDDSQISLLEGSS